MRFSLKVAGLALLLMGGSSILFAPAPTPEIDPSYGVNAIALLAGIVLVIRSRKRT